MRINSQILSWAFFDFANSSYTTAIMTVSFSIAFVQVIASSASEGSTWWALAIAMSMFLTVLVAPFIGCFIDHRGHRKLLLAASVALTAVPTGLLYFCGPGDLVLATTLIVLSNFGFSTGENIIASFLPFLGKEDELGRISGFAWGIGYLGGLLSVILLNFLGPTSVENLSNIRLYGPITALFFILGSLPTFLYLKEPPAQLRQGPIWSTALQQLGSTFKQVRRFRDMSFFMLGFLFSYSALNYIVFFAFIFASQEIHWSDSSKTISFILMQVFALVGAIGFGALQDRFGNLRLLNATLLVFAVAGFAVPFVYEESTFMTISLVVGLLLGAMQSAGRTLVALFAPPGKEGEFFGFWGLFGKLATGVAILGSAFVQYWLGIRASCFIAPILFTISLIINYLFVNEVRGRKARIS